MKYKILLFIALTLSFFIVSCANPLGKGTWCPLPFKSMQKNCNCKTPPKDSTQTINKK